MNSHDFVACIGKPEESPEVQAMLASVGVTQKLRMPKDDIDARHSLRDQGLTLIFKPEGPKSNCLIFHAVMFVSDAEPGYSNYPGDLPEGLTFSDTQEQALAKLGEPTISKPKLRRDIWDKNGLRLAINYAKESPQRIDTVTVQVIPEY